MDDTIPPNAGLRQDKELQYYQWVPIILLCMALLFKVPRMLWKLLTSSASFKLDKVRHAFAGTFQVRHLCVFVGLLL